ncbi:MAG: hypothetical protein HY316_07080 [Acidobacteria bacterium]|nr:hypothetical protein [Acidobacteriota bacterium]
MKRFVDNSIRIVATLILITAALLWSPTPGYAAGSTARTALEDATAAANKWSPDAILTTVYANTVGIDGKAMAWTYGFYSPKSRKYLNLTARGRFTDTLELITGQTTSVAADFLDSDKVMEEAVKAGVASETIRMRLSRTEWLVNEGDRKGALSVWLHPRTGKLIKRQTVP